MPHQTGEMPLTLFGFVIYGDLGDLTMYRSARGKLVVFQKTWPDKPPSYYQTIDRTRLAIAAEAWNQLSRTEKREWNNAAARASLCMTGYNLYVFCWIAPRTECLATIARQTQCDLTCACRTLYS